MADTSEQRLYVDRIEGDMAVLVEDSEEGHEVPVPLSRLPEGTREGQWLRVEVPASVRGNISNIRAFLAGDTAYSGAATRFVSDPEAAQAVQSRVKSLMDELS